MDTHEPCEAWHLNGVIKTQVAQYKHLPKHHPLVDLVYTASHPLKNVCHRNYCATQTYARHIGDGSLLAQSPSLIDQCANLGVRNRCHCLSSATASGCTPCRGQPLNPSTSTMCYLLKFKPFALYFRNPWMYFYAHLFSSRSLDNSFPRSLH